MVKILLDAGAEINATGGLYGSAFHAAVCCHYEGIVEFLLEKGADVHIKSENYGTPLEAASKDRYRTRTLTLLEQHVARLGKGN